MTAVGNYHRYQGAARDIPGPAPAPHIKDRRLVLLDGLVPGLFADGSAVLDVGCNAGAVTVQVAHYYDIGSATGVDVDPHLIKKAKSHFTLQSSRIRPATDDRPRELNYYPIAAVADLGLLERFLFGDEEEESSDKHEESSDDDEDSGDEHEDSGDKHEHSHDETKDSDDGASSKNPKWTSDLQTVQFIREDWAISKNPETSGPYDVILALSVVKWIHLKHLDAGLEAFFCKCASSLKEGGYFVIEVQSWSSYLTAITPGKTPHFEDALLQLKHRPETSFTELLEQSRLIHVATSEELPRRISVYRKA
ncbi:hypothetical protein BU16DRAFT_559238 [Lophium mytilinum]|uniref:RNA methyltransferase n=1 Tax=Lophium mytilinum TaxID=390894 RepID=A0A6A6R0X9_9PEZI|nr:hypothetical protein BU16DRAFT_559238 [Lophium mytilinum]